MSKEEEAKLLYGMLFSLKSFSAKLSPVDMKQGFSSYKTNVYRLSLFETPSSKCILQRVFELLNCYLIRSEVCI